MSNHFKSKFQAGRRIIFVTDLHGDLPRLNKLLDLLNYSEEKDLLVSAGDLIDRGPNSKEVFDFFFTHENRTTIMGNHEDMMLAALETDFRIPNWIANGGAWAAECSNEELADMYAKAYELPVALELETDMGELIGVVHAQVPAAFKTWKEFKLMASTYVGARQRAMWERTYVHDQKAPVLPDIDLVISGHSVMPQHKKLGNHLFLDTGSVFAEETNNYKLTAAVLSPNTPVNKMRIVCVK
jgi:serine/threonine protein phosphatase 1